MRRSLALLLLLFSAHALGDKGACVDHGEKLYVAQPENVDIQEAFKHCRPLAEAGDAEAQYYFASVFMFRTIRQPPASPAVEQWMKRSAEGGYGKAQLYMATVYRYGNDVTPRDAAKMMEMYEKAAGQGLAPAMRALVELYAGRDEARARYWRERLGR